MIGQTIAHYKITAKLGAGGMGEVYRAADTKLGRDIALKVLPPAFAQDAERMARFKREAQVLASLNHTNIASIHGIEESGGVLALVMELVEGVTLAERIAQGPIPLEEALGVVGQIVEALEAAHERGIIHRDLKPANIKLTPEGKVKVLDFGLAKALEGERPSGSGSGAGITQSPTITALGTQAGVILGTAAYMAPEQAKGKAADRRADIWSFGVVLFEMLAGRQPYGGETSSETLASVMKDEPDWELLPASIPPLIRHLLRRCLTKDVKLRLQAIGEVRIALTENLAAPSVAPGLAADEAPAHRRNIPWAWAAALVVFAAAATGALVWILGPRVMPQRAVWTQIMFSSGYSLSTGSTLPLDISPDGTQMVFEGKTGKGTQLFRRPLDQLEVVPISGTEGAYAPFFSPDGSSIGFWVERKLNILSLSGGAPIVITENKYGNCQGASWGTDNTIIFNGNHGEGLHRVSAAGGKVQSLTTVDPKKKEAGHHWPRILPGGKYVLFTIEVDGKPYDDALIVVQSLETGNRQILVQGGSDARYLPTGHLVYWRGKDLLAVPFDLTRLKLTGTPVAVVKDVMSSASNGFGFYAVSDEGTLVYVSGTNPKFEHSLVLVDRRGTAKALPAPTQAFTEVRVSPNGQQIVTTIVAANDDLWLYDLRRNAQTRITFEHENSRAVWSPDDKRIIFSSFTGGQVANLYWVPSDGSGVPERLTSSDSEQAPQDWSPDGRNILFTTTTEGSGVDLWVLPMEGEKKPRPFLQTRSNEGIARFSPDGRWVAYASDESGVSEIYVRPFPGPGGKEQVSVEGGEEPLWARNGRELFYRKGNRVMTVDVRTQPEFSAAQPRMLFQGDYLRLQSQSYDVLPDGQSFVMIRQKQGAAPLNQVTLVLNWFDELKKRVPPGKK